MTDAYETIWLDYGKDWFSARLTGNKTSVEYIRADIARPMTVAEAAKVLLGDADAVNRLGRYFAANGLDGTDAFHHADALRAMSQGGE